MLDASILCTGRALEADPEKRTTAICAQAQRFARVAVLPCEHQDLALLGSAIKEYPSYPSPNKSRHDICQLAVKDSHTMWAT